MKFGAALSAALLLGATVAIAACGGSIHPATATAPPSSTSTQAQLSTTTTATTGTYTVVGTTPQGETVTQTSTYVTTTPVGPDGVAVQAGTPIGLQTNTTIQGQTLDGIGCSRLNQLAYQVSAHLQIDVRGRPRILPGNIGLITPRDSVTGTVTTYRPGLCAYWVHTVAPNGVIEVRSPVPRTYRLGALFDLWGEPLSPRQVAGARGAVTAIVDGRRWRGNPRSIPLREHESIELAVDTPIPRFRPVDWSGTDL